MKPKQSPSKKDEPGIIDFVVETKPKTKEAIAGIINLEDNNVKQALESAMTLLFKSLGEVIELQRKARVVRDG